MNLVPHIKSYNPLNCAIIAQVYSESQSSHLAIPTTRTQLYRALTHCILAGYIGSKETSYDTSSMLSEGLNNEDVEKFKMLAKFTITMVLRHKNRFSRMIPKICQGELHFSRRISLRD